MSASLVLIAVMAVLFAVGIYLMLERSLTRVLIGFLLVGNAVNLLLFSMSGRPGIAPFTGAGDGAESGAVSTDMVDPLPQALILTAIVINFGLSALFLALIYRSWWLARLGTEGDTVPDQHAAETTRQTEDTFRPAREDDEAIREAVEAGDRDDEYSEAPELTEFDPDRPHTSTIDVDAPDDSEGR